MEELMAAELPSTHPPSRRGHFFILAGGWVFALVEALENDPCAHGLALGFLTFFHKSFRLRCYYDTCWINVICQESSKLRFNTIGLIIRRLFVMKMLLPMLPNRATKARAEKGQMMTPRRHRPLGETGGTNGLATRRETRAVSDPVGRIMDGR